jgi:hypothetical protein
MTSLIIVINMAHPEQMIDKCEADITGVNDWDRQERKSGDLADSTLVHEEAECSSGDQYEMKGAQGGCLAYTQLSIASFCIFLLYTRS